MSTVPYNEWNTRIHPGSGGGVCQVLQHHMYEAPAYEKLTRLRFSVMGIVKTQIENSLRRFPFLFRLGSKVYHTFNGSFRTLSPGTPQALHEAFSLAKENSGGHPIGDYYEFGLFRGFTFLEAYKHCQSLGLTETHLFGFDSFEGLPEPADEIDAVDNRFFKGQFACSLSAVKKNLQNNGMNFDKATFIKGFYSDSLTEELRQKHTFGRAAVVLLDCDYYSSTIEALNWLLPYLYNQSILLFDDWFSYGDSNELGQQLALQEFLNKNPEFRAEPLMEFRDHGKGFVLLKG